MKKTPANKAAKPKSKTAAGTAAALAQVRTFCLALADVTEKISHGFPTYFYKKRVLGYFLDNHHGDGRLALWLPAEPGVQDMLIDSNPEVYFKPPYVGPSGWIGVRLDRDAAWPEVASLIDAAHTLLVAKRR